MQNLFIYILTVLYFVPGNIDARKGFGPGEQEWGYVEVRPYAHMFWWLYYTTANVSSFYDKPLVIWLQGGPGGSSTSFGNFEELGPLDTNLNPRNYTWIKNYNVLFIDNPVGTGFSYTENDTALATTNAQIASDLVECMRGFYKQLPKFENVPTYITTESYGGKMGAEFAVVWYRAQKAGTIKSNLKGIEIGDAWISPIDSVMTWAPFLLATGMVDTEGFEKIDAAAKITKDKVESNQWVEATLEWSFTENRILEVTSGIDFYNILTKITYSDHLSRQNAFVTKENISIVQPYIFALDSLMNGPVKKALGLTVVHGAQSNKVFNYLMEDFMKPVIHQVELLLNETNLNVFVLTGHMDLIVDTPGTLIWVEKLKWKDADAWKKSKRYPLVSENIIEGYFKAQNNFRLYWVNRAGHMVPRDNPAAQKIVLRDLTSNAGLNKNET